MCLQACVAVLFCVSFYMTLILWRKYTVFCDANILCSVTQIHPRCYTKCVCIWSHTHTLPYYMCFCVYVENIEYIYCAFALWGLRFLNDPAHTYAYCCGVWLMLDMLRMLHVVHLLRCMSYVKYVTYVACILTTTSHSLAKHPILCDIFRFIEKYRNCHTKQNNFLQNKVSFLGLCIIFLYFFFSFSVLFYKI